MGAVLLARIVLLLARSLITYVPGVLTVTRSGSEHGADDGLVAVDLNQSEGLSIAKWECAGG